MVQLPVESCAFLLMVLLSVLPSPSSPLDSLPIGNCLQLTNGQFNIGCPTFQSNTAICFVNGTASDPLNPYSRLCDGVDDCINNFLVDEGSNATHVSNGLLDCEPFSCEVCVCVCLY